MKTIIITQLLYNIKKVTLIYLKKNSIQEMKKKSKEKKIKLKIS
jgi:hypothetical protein